jgi:hypothetical protein
VTRARAVAPGAPRGGGGVVSSAPAGCTHHRIAAVGPGPPEAPPNPHGPATATGRNPCGRDWLLLASCVERGWAAVQRGSGLGRGEGRAQPGRAGIRRGRACAGQPCGRGENSGGGAGKHQASRDCVDRGPWGKVRVSGPARGMEVRQSRGGGGSANLCGGRRTRAAKGSAGQRGEAWDILGGRRGRSVRREYSRGRRQ